MRDTRIKAEEIWRLKRDYRPMYEFGEHRIKIAKVGRITDEMLDAVEFYDMEVRPIENFALGRDEFIEKFERIY